MENFFSANWFPLNIIIVLAVGGVAVLIWGLVTNWGKGHPTTPSPPPSPKCPPPDDKSLKLYCGGVCINPKNFKCINDAPCENEKATTTTCCEYLARDNNCVPCPLHSPVCNSKEGGSQCCATKDCNSEDGCCGMGIWGQQPHNCDDGCCATDCCIGSSSTCCVSPQQCHYPSHSPGALNSHSPAGGTCQVKCGVQWCKPNVQACAEDTLELRPNTGVCDKESDTTYTACSHATSCEPGISCNYGVCAKDTNTACTDHGCPHNNQGCKIEHCDSLNTQWGTKNYDPLELGVYNTLNPTKVGTLCGPGTNDCTPYITYKNNDNSSYFCATDNGETLTRTATRKVIKGTSNTEACFQTMNEPGLVDSVWDPKHSICTGYFSAATDSRFPKCSICPLTNEEDACCKDDDRKLTGKICSTGLCGAADKCYWGSYCGFDVDGKVACNLSLNQPDAELKYKGVGNCNGSSHCPTTTLVHDQDLVYIVFLDDTKWYFISNAGEDDGISHLGCKKATPDFIAPIIHAAQRTDGFNRVYQGGKNRPNQYDCVMKVNIINDPNGDPSIVLEGRGGQHLTVWNPNIHPASPRWCGGASGCSAPNTGEQLKYFKVMDYKNGVVKPVDVNKLEYGMTYSALGVDGNKYTTNSLYLQVYQDGPISKMQLSQYVTGKGHENASDFKIIRGCALNEENPIGSGRCGQKN